MKDISTILILLVSCLMLMSVMILANRSKPGIILYNNLRQRNLSSLNCLHGICIMIMLLPAVIIKQVPVFILDFPNRITIPQTLAFLLCFAVLGLFPWKKFNDVQSDDVLPTTTYPIILYAGIRIMFLITYEWFFRGLLLLSLCEWLGTTPGIIINVLLYTLLHAIKRSKPEIIGCIPLGILLCVFTIWWQSIWPAIIFHLQIFAIAELPQLKQFLSPKKQTAL